MRMKKVVLLVCAAAFALLALQAGGWAHPPKKIDLAYRADSGELVVTVSHGVRNPDKHYIERVLVYVDGAKTMEQSFEEQTSGQTHSVTLEVGSLASGSEVRVEATCNIFGTRDATMVIP